MIPSTAVFNQTQALLAADASTLAPAADANIVSLVISNFVPAKNLNIGSLTLATFTGSTPKPAGLGAQTVFLDPLTNERVIQIKEPVGGWSWVCTATPGTPETVFGVILTNDDGTVYLGSELLPTPVEIAASGQGLTVGALFLRFLDNSPY